MSQATLALVRAELFWERQLLRQAFLRPVTKDVLRRWSRDPRLARLGYTAACALRWGVVGL